MDNLLYLFTKDQTEKYRTETKQSPPSRSPQDTYKFYSGLMESKLKKTVKLEEHDEQNSGLFVGSDDETTEVTPMGRAVPKGVPETSERMKRELIALKQENAALKKRV